MEHTAETRASTSCLVGGAHRCRAAVGPCTCLARSRSDKQASQQGPSRSCPANRLLLVQFEERARFRGKHRMAMCYSRRSGGPRGTCCASMGRSKAKTRSILAWHRQCSHPGDFFLLCRHGHPTSRPYKRSNRRPKRLYAHFTNLNSVQIINCIASSILCDIIEPDH